MSNLLSLVISPAEECLPLKPDGSPPDTNVWRSIDGKLCAFSRSHGDRHWLNWPGVASFRFTGDGDAVTAVPYAPTRLELIRTTFHHSVLPLALQARGRESLHASAVLTDNGVVGICGTAQTGKSTLAYALSGRGRTQWSDDAIVWDFSGKRPTTIALPFEVRLRPPASSLFRVASRSAVKAPPTATSHAPLAALCVLARAAIDRTAPPVSIERLGGAHALTTVLEHAHCFNPYNAVRKRQMLVNYLELLSRVPVYEVRFQPVLAFLPHLVDAIIDEVDIT